MSARMIIKLHFSLFLLFVSNALFAQQAVPGEPPRLLPDKESVLVTLVLKHVQTKNISQIREERDANGFADFPPEGVDLVADYRMLNLGRVMVLRVPAELLRITTIAIEEKVWGPYETDIYLTYDLIEARRAHEEAINAMRR